MVSSYALQTHFTPSNLQLQFSNRTVHQNKKVQDYFFPTIFRANTVKDYNSFSQWNTSRTVSLKVLRQTHHTDTSTLPISVCLHQLNLKSKRIVADLTVSPPPNTSLRSLWTSLSKAVRTHSPCPQEHNNLSRRMLFFCP